MIIDIDVDGEGLVENRQRRVVISLTLSNTRTPRALTARGESSQVSVWICWISSFETHILPHLSPVNLLNPVPDFVTRGHRLFGTGKKDFALLS